jgi:GWxTD domain-containing protein
MRTRLMRRQHFFLFITLFLLFFSGGLSQLASQQEPQKKEPLSEYSKQWLDEVVPYIITPKEREFFINLPNEEERGKFIELFWKKRDPNPQTPENEFKVEYYKRMAAANRLFGTGGIAGWRTDRGKIYILLGPPKEIQRDMNPQSPGNTLVSVFQGSKETWQYWGLPNPNLPYNMEFVFVDKFSTGNYMLENTFRVDSGRNRPFDASQLTYQFDYQEWLAEAQKNPFEGFDKLKEIITTQVSYTHIPFRSEVFYFRGAEKKTFIPLALEIQPSSLTPKKINDNDYYSLSLILNVSNSLGQLVFEKSRDLNFQSPISASVSEHRKPFLVETAITLEPGVYKLHVLVLDNFSGKVGTSHEEISVPSFSSEELAVSDILLSSQALGAMEKKERAFPEQKGQTDARRVFQAGEELNVYFEVYNLTLDPATGSNKFKVDYSFVQGGKLVTQVPAAAITPTAERDCRVQISFRLRNFKTGEYALRVDVTDELSGKSQTREAPLVIVE